MIVLAVAAFFVVGKNRFTIINGPSGSYLSGFQSPYDTYGHALPYFPSQIPLESDCFHAEENRLGSYGSCTADRLNAFMVLYNGGIRYTTDPNFVTELSYIKSLGVCTNAAYAKNPETGECRQFDSYCVVPQLADNTASWQLVDSCPSTSASTQPPVAGQPPSGAPSACQALQQPSCLFYEDRVSGGTDIQGCPVADTCVLNQTKLNLISVFLGATLLVAAALIVRSRRKK